MSAATVILDITVGYDGRSEGRRQEAMISKAAFYAAQVHRLIRPFPSYCKPGYLPYGGEIVGNLQGILGVNQRETGAPQRVVAQRSVPSRGK